MDILRRQTTGVSLSAGRSWGSCGVDTDKQKRIKRRAYAFWEAEGQPHGRDEEHWHLAARQIEAEETAPISEKHKKRRNPGRGAVIPGPKRSKK